MRAFCEDGRDFIAGAVKRLANNPFDGYKPRLSQTEERKAKRRNQQSKEPSTVPPPSPQLPPRKRIDHFVMNLPDSAITFLDAFQGVLAPPALRDLYKDRMPQVHCYCFTREREEKDAKIDISKVLIASPVKLPSLFVDLLSNK